MISIRPLDPGEVERWRPALVRLLEDAVEGGASIGFLLPLERSELDAYWRSVAAAMPDGRRRLLAAFEDGQLIGTVQLGLEARPNGRHRAEVMKLMVQRTHRRRGALADGCRHGGDQHAADVEPAALLERECQDQPAVALALV